MQYESLLKAVTEEHDDVVVRATLEKPTTLPVIVSLKTTTEMLRRERELFMMEGEILCLINQK